MRRARRAARRRGGASASAAPTPSSEATPAGAAASRAPRTTRWWRGERERQRARAVARADASDTPNGRPGSARSALRRCATASPAPATPPRSIPITRKTRPLRPRDAGAAAPRSRVRRAAAGRCGPGTAARAASPSARCAGRPAATSDAGRGRQQVARRRRSPRARHGERADRPLQARHVREVDVVSVAVSVTGGSPPMRAPPCADRHAVSTRPWTSCSSIGDEPRLDVRRDADPRPDRARDGVADQLAHDELAGDHRHREHAARTTSRRTSADQEHRVRRRSIAMTRGSCARGAPRAGVRAALSRVQDRPRLHGLERAAGNAS